jgi:hypothetical protein
MRLCEVFGRKFEGEFKGPRVGGFKYEFGGKRDSGMALDGVIRVRRT